MLGKLLKLLNGGKAGAQDVPPAPGFEASDRLIAEGNRAEEVGDFPVACDHYRRAVAAAPRYAKAHLNLAIGLEAIGNAAEARRSYEAALAIDPGDVLANYNFGRQLFLGNSQDRAEQLLRRAIDGNPDFPDARIVLAQVLENKGDLNAAATELEMALRVRPDYLGALRNYADVLLKLDRLTDAETVLRRAAALEPGSFDTNFKLGAVLVRLQEPAEAERFFNQALRINPGSIHVHAALVNLHTGRGKLEAAAAAAEAALRLRPDWVDLLYNYGVILKRMMRLADAEPVFQRAIELDPAYWRAYHMLGAVLISQCRLRDALEVFEKGRANCADCFDLESAELFALNCMDDISVDELFARHQAVGKRLESLEPARFDVFDNAPGPDRRLRIGFVSADFRFHVVPLFLMPMLEHRNRSAIEVYCYSTGDTADDITERLRARSDVWRAVGRVSARDIADLIHRDRIDILIDLAGHSGVPNLRVFAQHPAPVQATWLGYLNTTGLTRIDYRLSDNQCDPEGLTDRYHTEKLLRLPHSQWCYRPFAEVDVDGEPPMLRNGYATFGSFNQTVKISAATRKLWAEILARLPASRLTIVGVSDSRARDDLYRDLADAGVDRDRITVIPYVRPEEYYRQYRQVDIALDTMPFSGGTTSCDSVWMGVPVVTVPGIRSWSRSAASVLATVGLNDWIAASPEDYVRRAVQFAQQPAMIAQLRTSLRSRMLESPLMDAPGFARDMENALRRMWRTWCAQTGR